MLSPVSGKQTHTGTIPSSLSLAESSRLPRLTHEEECDLARLAQSGDEAALHRMVLANMRLVISIAKSYATPTLPLEDQIQNGTIGLQRATLRFDPDRNVRFGTYATYWIRSAIIAEMRKTARLIRLPQHVQEKLWALDRATDAWVSTYGREPAASDLAACLGIAEAAVLLLQTSRTPVLSLDGPSERGDEEGRTLLERLVDQQALSPCEVASTQDEAEQIRHAVHEALSLLTERERQAVSLRFGLGGESLATYEEIGRVMGTRSSRVRQLLVHAFEKLRHSPGLLARAFERGTQG